MYFKRHDLPIDLDRTLRADAEAHDSKGNILTRVELSFLSRSYINRYLAMYGMRFEYAMMFRWKAGDFQYLHIDGTPPDSIRNASLNLVIKGGEGASFEWHDAKVLDKPRVTANGIQSFRIDESTARLLHREPLHQCMAVATCVPHMVTNITTETHLLCVRAQGNPPITQF